MTGAGTANLHPDLHFMATSSALDKRAYRGSPAGYPHRSFPCGDLILHPSQWDKAHWSFDDALRTRRGKVHKPISTTEALDIVNQLLIDLAKSVSK